MSVAGNLRMYARFAARLREYLTRPLTLEAAHERARRQLEGRADSFLAIVRRAVFEHPGSPYLPLLRAAGCEFGDLCSSVRGLGLEGALLELRRAGVYVSFEEMKGREPIVRPGVEIHPTDRDFDNPFAERHYVSESGGSTGPGTRISHDLGHLENQAVIEMIGHQAHGVLDAPHATWRGILPDGSGVNTILRAARYGRILERWYTHVLPGSQVSRLSKYSLATYGIVTLARANGAPLPWPERVRLNEPEVVAHWIGSALREHGSCLLSGVASRALRVCRAAEVEGIDLTGATFRVGGEPFTPAKLAAIERTGARAFATYGFVELGRVGMACPSSGEPNDVHLAPTMAAMIQHTRKVPPSGAEVPTFLFTSLTPTATKILLNAESDDFGVADERRCGCPLEGIGWKTHLREIRSFRRLTGEGVSILGSDLERILEAVLPARFGGGPLDYQLVETEDADGRTRLDLLVDPAVSIDDDTEVAACVLAELREMGTAARSGSEVWSQAQALRVRREKPIPTKRGKLLSLHVPGR